MRNEISPLLSRITCSPGTRPCSMAARSANCSCSARFPERESVAPPAPSLPSLAGGWPTFGEDAVLLRAQSARSAHEARHATTAVVPRIAPPSIAWLAFLRRDQNDAVGTSDAIRRGA